MNVVDPNNPAFENRYAVIYRITFKDGGEPEYGHLYVGDKGSCERVMNALPAVAYGGPRPVDKANMVVVSLAGIVEMVNSTEPNEDRP